MKRLALLLLPLSAFAAAPVTDWSPNGTATAAWHGNASNGAAVWDRVGALALSADVLATSGYDFTKSDALHVTAHLGGEWFPRFRRLGQGLAGGRVDWQHVFGSGDLAPVFTVEGAADYVAGFESMRSGTLTAGTVKLSKRFAGGWHAAISQRFEQFYARGAVFDSNSDHTVVEVGRDLGQSTRVVLTGRWRDGDVVTYAQYDRPDLVAIARDMAEVRTFGYTSTAYATDARTVAGKFALIHATDTDTAVIASYEYATTRRTDLRFANSIIAVSFVRQF